ncbi:cytochrome c biogenesis protein CcsA [Akkermansia sp. N21169]|jgi:ABC-type uncharacterized transport system permease subunit|uniref:cytochrome c biogenesis protein CcsA n=1 Tax=Akkermansia sp. N21169 TaxID=3040765 RepID=UPI00244E9432|nr:cytochrome c biogenesis protein CcsA [Akkermansia sp. N21169]MDH3069769.1 cytochrome c biogenesis protein CcsA [Akkermansia sp. N21169]
MNDQYWMIAAVVWALCVSGSGALSLFHPGRSRRLVWVLMLVLMLIQSVALMERSALGATCPIRGRSEVLFFLGWALNAFYLVLGRPYRMSVIGAFTAPLVAVLSLLAVLFYDPVVQSLVGQGWLTWHIGLAMLGYGALGLSALSAVVFLIQNSLMKAGRLTGLSRNLPPVRTLQSCMIRLIDAGFLLLMLAQICGLQAWMAIPVAKCVVAAAVSVGYLLLISVTYLRGLPGKVLAWWSIGLYVLSLSIFLVLQ